MLFQTVEGAAPAPEQAENTTNSRTHTDDQREERGICGTVKGEKKSGKKNPQKTEDEVRDFKC